MSKTEIVKNKTGRPRTLSATRVKKLVKLFDEYIENHDFPNIAHFAYENKINRQCIYDYEEFSTLRKRCIDKKESSLEYFSLKGKINTTQAIFSLKQLGWKDKQEIEHSGEIDQTVFVLPAKRPIKEIPDGSVLPKELND